jgi:hypothetical protein
MSQESWWFLFYQKFQNAINLIEAEVDEIHKSPYDFHVAAKVFGKASRKMVSDAAVKAFNLLCQFALGYIDHLGKRHSLSGQQAITQKSGGPRGTAEAFAKACDRFGKPNTDVPDMVTFLAQF